MGVSSRGLQGGLGVVLVCLIGCGSSGSDAGTGADAGATFTVSTRVADFETDAPVENVLFELYRFSDTTTPFASGVTNALGEVDLEVVQPGEPFYTRLSATGYKDSYDFDVAVYTDIIIINTFYYLIIGTAAWDAAFASVMAVPDPAAGSGVVTLNQPMGNLDGFEVTVNSGGSVVYFAGGVPDLMATATDGDGEAYLLNVPSGAATVTATNAATGVTGTAEMILFPDSAHAVRLLLP